MTRRRFTLDDPPFAAGTGRGVTVAVVDSGVHAAHPHVRGVAGGVFLDDSGEADDYTDRIGHGTAVAAAIHEKAPDAALLAVKVFDRSLATSAVLLARGIAWAADHGARLINCSLGTANVDRETILRDAVDHATARGAFIVSASDWNGRPWFPGALPGVVGVCLDWSGDRHALDTQPTGDGITMTASGYPRPIPGVPPARNLSGVSFAVANASGFLARLLSARADIVTLAAMRRALFDEDRG